MDNNFKKIERILYDYKYLKLYVENKEKLKNDIENEVPGSIRAVATDSIAVSRTNNVRSCVETEVLEKIKEITKIEKSMYEPRGKIELIEKTLENMQPIYKELFEEKYIKEQRVDKIAQEMHVSEKTVYNLRNKLVKAMELAFFGGR